MDIQIPSQVKLIINMLNNNGYDAYAVGGCVRDYFLNREPHDWDITTNALPREIISIFNNNKLILNGLKHGTVAVVLDNEIYEITTYRVDGDYLDNRHPSFVTFTASLKEDLQRRDFTINALAVNTNGDIKDFFNGIQDINNKLIRAVGNPDSRFNEDALRIIRGLRFAAVLNYSVEEKTAESIHKNKWLLKNIAVERIAVELNKLICADKPAVILNEYKDVFAAFIPELEATFTLFQSNPNHNQLLWKHILNSVDNIENNLILRLTMLFHDIGKPASKTTDKNGIDHYYAHPKISADITRKILRRLHYSNEVIYQVCTLVENHDQPLSGNKRFVTRLLNKIGTNNCNNLIKVRTADVMAQSNLGRQEKIDNILAFEKTLNNIIKENNCFSLKQLAVDGKDLIEIGITDGKEIGSTLKILLEMVINQQVENEKQALIEIAEKAKPHPNN